MNKKEVLFNKLKRDNNYRTTVLIITFSISLLLWHLKIIPDLNPILAIAFTCAISIIIIYSLLYKDIANFYMDYGVSTCDFILITVLIYYTGGIESSFYLIYIVTILIETMDLVNKKHMIYDIVVSLFLYAFVIIMMNYKNLSNLLIHHLVTREAFILLIGIIALQYANIINAKEEEVIRANEEKVEAVQELAAGVLHEIRNPLAGIKLLVQGLDSELGDDGRQTEYLSEISKEVDKLTKFSIDFLNYSRPFNLKLREVDLESLIEEVLFVFMPKLNNKIEISKEVFPNLKIIGDKERIREVLFNIIDNAIQSIEEKGKINIHAKPIDSNFTSIKISDTGIGISLENLDKIFKPFFTLKERGTGLGLSICKRIIEAHNGSIEVESQLGVSTTFSINLPLK